MTELNNKIIQLRKNGKSFRQIAILLNCSRGTVSYYLGIGQKEKARNRTRKLRKIQHPYLRKIENFSIIKNRKLIKSPLHKTRKLIQLKTELFVRNRITGEYMKPSFTVEDVLNKFGENPKCYLTGQDIDINKPRTYAFDHIVPVSRGGNNSIENLGICTKQANQSKFDMTPEEFINFCKLVVEHNNRKSSDN